MRYRPRTQKVMNPGYEARVRYRTTERRLSHFLAQLWLNFKLQAVACRELRPLLCLVTVVPNRREQKGRTLLKRAPYRSGQAETLRGRSE